MSVTLEASKLWKKKVGSCSRMEENLDRDLRSVSIAAVNEVERESKLFSGTSTTGEIADSVQLSRSCEQNRGSGVLPEN
ncbi:hypothetical protein IGI04_013519 [Brassica rapa subsp. trilocularis]|uniref:VAN3-binding protein-like auxin canalisation domain-containing protein n=1 Tax=Brassica rapa subsp. trilocularis TaxID=1813537 RepID=A0ABQ7N923_BRACM|nr:hypothetical protein IGI04_013519 [Brassica rapa subsp. trilocularis]